MQSISLPIPHFEQEKTYSCVAACVRMVLNYYGVNASEDGIRRLLGTKLTGTRFVNLARAVPWWDLNLELGEFNFQQLNTFITSKEAPIIFLKTGLLDYWNGLDVAHAVVLTNIDAKTLTVEVNDPFFTGPQRTSVDILKAAWVPTGNLAAILRQR